MQAEINRLSEFAKNRKRAVNGRFVKIEKPENPETENPETGAGGKPETEQRKIKAVSVKNFLLFNNRMQRKQNAETVKQFREIIETEVKPKMEKIEMLQRNGKTDLMLDVETKVKKAFPYIALIGITGGALLTGYILSVFSLLLLLSGFISGYIVKSKQEEKRSRRKAEEETKQKQEQE